MELWIRSQDRTRFIKVKEVHTDGCLIKTWSDGRICDIGEYESNERALEILDDIQKMLMIGSNMNGRYEELDLKIKTLILNNLYKIYVMPEK